jgi:type IV fimbrial biogenesis protein FimT
MAHGAMGSLMLCPPSPVSGNMSYMAINIAGRFRVERDKDADGQITLPWGTKIHCSG